MTLEQLEINQKPGRTIAVDSVLLFNLISQVVLDHQTLNSRGIQHVFKELAFPLLEDAMFDGFERKTN